MPSIAEKAKAEADRVEAEEAEQQGEDAPAEQPAADPVEEEAAELEAETETDDSPEQMMKQLERSLANFKKALVKLFGDDEPLEEIPQPGALGFMMPGYTAHRTHENFIRCDTCNGHGKVLTGSLAGENALANCPRCAGRGYLEKMVQPQQPQTVPVVTGPTAFVTQPLSNGADEYGVPAWMGNPDVRPSQPQ